MFCEQMRDGLVFMDKVEQSGMTADEQQAHWDAFNDFKAQGFKIVLFDTEAEAVQAADDYRRRGLVSGRSKRGSGKKKSGGGDNRVSTFMVATKLLPENFEGWDAAELATLDVVCHNVVYTDDARHRREAAAGAVRPLPIVAVDEG